jgi:hypothetical protein
MQDTPNNRDVKDVINSLFLGLDYEWFVLREFLEFCDLDLKHYVEDSSVLTNEMLTENWEAFLIQFNPATKEGHIDIYLSLIVLGALFILADLPLPTRIQSQILEVVQWEDELSWRWTFPGEDPLKDQTIREIERGQVEEEMLVEKARLLSDFKMKGGKFLSQKEREDFLNSFAQELERRAQEKLDALALERKEQEWMEEEFDEMDRVVIEQRKKNILAFRDVVKNYPTSGT